VLDNPSEKINPEIRAPYLLESEPLEESGNPAFEESTVMPLESTPVSKSRLKGKLGELRKELELLEGLEAEKLEEGTFITNPEVLGTGLITRRRGRK